MLIVRVTEKVDKAGTVSQVTTGLRDAPEGKLSLSVKVVFLHLMPSEKSLKNVL